MEEIRLWIEGAEVAAAPGTTILKAALDAGIYIPNLCSHPDLDPLGACRLCVVEVEGRPGLTSACTAEAEPGMRVIVNSPELTRVRRTSVELMLATHPEDCTSCPKYGNCELQSLYQYLGANPVKYGRRNYGHIPNMKNPLFVHDFGRCILCERCVRVCRDLRGVGVLSMEKDSRGNPKITVRNELLTEGDCRFCGACVEVCPTGSLQDKEGLIDKEAPRSLALVPCKNACPAGTDIPRYIRSAGEGDFAQAAAVLRERLTFPKTLGYICNHVCELSCRRGELNDPVSIKELKRYAIAKGGDGWKEKLCRHPRRDTAVAVVGGGPAGMSAAYDLALAGHKVTVYEAMPHAGGMLYYGIPRYRLPREAVDEELSTLLEAGITLKTNVRVESPKVLLGEGYDAVLVAVGTHKGSRLPIPNGELAYLNTDFLRAGAVGEPMPVGERVAVLGGGSVAFDCACTARRQGAKSVTVLCLESREEMKAPADEVEDAEAEGIRVLNRRTFTALTAENGAVTGVACQTVREFKFDENGRAQIAVEEGSDQHIPADTVIFAVGQTPDLPAGFGLETGRGNRILVSKTGLVEGETRLFAAGDCVTGTLSVVEAVAAGRRAAAEIDRCLGGTGMLDQTLAEPARRNPHLGREEGFAARERMAPGKLPPERRRDSFEAFNQGLEEEAARRECARCLQCDLRLDIGRQKLWSEYAGGKGETVNASV